MSDLYRQIIDHAAAAEKVNYTLYQLAIEEIALRSMNADPLVKARALRELRNMMEKQFNLPESLDGVVDISR